MKNNKGMSYIELILVLSIALILTGIGTFSYGMIRRTNITKAADKTISKINEARSMKMVKGCDATGKDNGIIAFTNKNGNIYCYVGKDFDSIDMSSQDWEKICVKPVTMEVTDKSGSTSELGENGVVKTKFKQSTGEITDGITNITYKTSKNSVRIKIYKATGKPVLE